jgi:hypothetical protein
MVYKKFIKIGSREFVGGGKRPKGAPQREARD